MLMIIDETGDYQIDYDKGRASAAAFTQRLRRRSVTPFMLGDIADEFNLRYGPIERGFMAEISYQLIDYYPPGVEKRA